MFSGLPRSHLVLAGEAPSLIMKGLAFGSDHCKDEGEARYGRRVKSGLGRATEDIGKVYLTLLYSAVIEHFPPASTELLN